MNPNDTETAIAKVHCKKPENLEQAAPVLPTNTDGGKTLTSAQALALARLLAGRALQDYEWSGWDEVPLLSEGCWEQVHELIGEIGAGLLILADAGGTDSQWIYGELS